MIIINDMNIIINIVVQPIVISNTSALKVTNTAICDWSVPKISIST